MAIIYNLTGSNKEELNSKALDIIKTNYGKKILYCHNSSDSFVQLYDEIRSEQIKSQAVILLKPNFPISRDMKFDIIIVNDKENAPSAIERFQTISGSSSNKLINYVAIKNDNYLYVPTIQDNPELFLDLLQIFPFANIVEQHKKALPKLKSPNPSPQIIEKVRIVTFKGTPEQVEKQESNSRPFGTMNTNSNRCCEVKIEDASNLDLSQVRAYRLKTIEKGQITVHLVIPLNTKYINNQWVLKAYNISTQRIVEFPLASITN